MKNLEYHANLIAYQLMTRNITIAVGYKQLADRVVEILAHTQEVDATISRVSER